MHARQMQGIYHLRLFPQPLHATSIATSSLVSPSLIWKILQNQTMIFDNHSTTLCSMASIISLDRDHASLLLQVSWTFLQEGTQLH
jgi:hypothetical protein